MKIGDRIRQFGEKKFKYIKDFANALNMDPSNLQAYLRGDREPGTPLLKKLIELGCDVNWLLTGIRIDKSINYISEQKVVYGSNLVKPEYRIEATIPAGISEIQDTSEWAEYEDLYFEPNEHYYIKIDREFGYSMMPLVNEGDLVLVSFSAKVLNGDLVVARWAETKGALKIYNEHKGNIVLTSYNQAVNPIFLIKNEAQIYKVVLIKKKKKANK